MLSASYGASYQYAPHDLSPQGRAARETVAVNLKRDLPFPDPPLRPTKLIAQKLAAALEAHPYRAELQSAEWLVPVPSHSPLLPSGESLWVPRVLCRELRAVGIGREVVPALVRVHSVQQSSKAAQERKPRPTFEAQRASLAVEVPLQDPPQSILVVDDVVTSGTTLLACVSRLVERFPGASVACYAAVRAMKGEEPVEWVNHVRGTLTMRDGEKWGRRTP